MTNASGSCPNLVYLITLLDGSDLPSIMSYQVKSIDCVNCCKYNGNGSDTLLLTIAYTEDREMAGVYDIAITGYMCDT